MNPLPLISIITVTYNAEDYLAQTIESVLAQTYQNIEYIIIDGYSTDRTIAIINNYELRITIALKHFMWMSEKDCGIYNAMNKGIRLAHGELIGMINASDFYEPNTVEMVVNKYSKNKDTGIFHGNVNMLNDDGSFFKLKKPNTNLEDLYKGMSLYHPTFFVAKSVYEKYGFFDLQYKIAADFDFALRCNLAGVKFCYLDYVISNFRKGGVSSKKIKAAHQECKKILIQNGYPEATANAVAKEWERLRKKDNLYYWLYSIFKHFLPISLINKIAEHSSVK